MPGDLLPGWEPAAVPGGPGKLEELVSVAVRDVGMIMEGMKGSAAAFESAWQRLVLDVAGGKTNETHALRPRLLSALEKQLSWLQETQALLTWLRNLGRTDVAPPDILAAEIAGLQGLKARVFDHWQTAEDLEDLAARDYPLTTADLDSIGPHRTPPPSYYAEESKPF
jgi:hypothetical protein